MSSAMQDTPSADAGGAASAGEPGQNQVLGERATTLVDRAVSAQSRLSNVLAISLMSVLGLGSLTWYYANSMTRQSRARHNVQSASATRAAGDTSLPSLGRIDPPLPPSPPSELPVDPADRVQLAASLPEIPLTGTAPSYAAASPPPTPEQLAQQRQLSGAVFSSASTSGASVPPSAPSQGAAWTGAGPSTASGSAPGDISALLRPSTATAVRAEVLPAQRLLLPKGAFIDCTLETAIDSTLPGMTTCVMATDAFGVDGSVVLLERGTKLVGETKGQVQQGQARVFVLWTEARTPAGVNRHFWERFGAAMLISIIDGAVETTASRSGGGTVIVDPSASQGVMTEVLKGTANIPPTVVKLNGDRIQVLVARDLDFRSVYELRATAGR
jgi:type IV secretion system protein VirB10